MLHQLEAGYIVTHVTVDWENSDIFYVAKSASNSRVRHVLWVESNLLFNKTEQIYRGYHSNWNYIFIVQPKFYIAFNLSVIEEE